MRERDVAGIKRLMAERSTVRERMAQQEACEAEGAKSTSRGADIVVAEQRLKAINAELQAAMRKRDTKAIRALMAERSTVQKTLRAADASPLAEKPRAGNLGSDAVPAKGERALTGERHDSRDPSVGDGAGKGEEEEEEEEERGGVPPPPEPPSLVQRNSTLNSVEEFQMRDEIAQFVDVFVGVFSEACQGRGRDQQFRAAVFERWQMFEMEHENPKIIFRCARLIATDSRFTKTLRRAITSKVDCLRDAAGIVFRLRGMYVDGELPRAGADAGQLLGDAVEAILAPFEATPPKKIDGHFIGALYMQSVTPWLCSIRSNTATSGIIALVQRVGRACVHWWKAGNKQGGKSGVRGSLIEMYMGLTHVPIWGSQEDDVVWKTFYK
jgi:hypothetical protein